MLTITTIRYTEASQIWNHQEPGPYSCKYSHSENDQLCDTKSSQLVVVGDQSSGKSSLLDGLTGLYFPVASDLCTRHATQIVLRRVAAHEAALRISILPGHSSIDKAGEKERLDKFARCIKATAFGADEFASILDEVRRASMVW